MNDTLLPSRLPLNSALAREYDLTSPSWRVLVESIFPAAKTVESVLMALAYCKARQLDIYKRPVHIVPMWDSNKDNGPNSRKGGWIETVWEGISSIRTTAARTGAYAGIDAVEYGPMIKREFRGEKDVWERGQKTGTDTITRTVEYPEWASVVVYRMVGGARRAYHAKVFWREAYGTMGKMEVPNEMWAKRPYGQLDKCVEAAALRKAFPEELGSTYTVDEMEGHTIEGSVIEEESKLVPPKPPAKETAKPATEEKPKEEPKKEEPKKEEPKAKPKAKAKPKPEPEPEQEEVGSASFEDDGEADDGPAPGDLLSALDAALEGAGTEEEVEEIWNEHDLEARLESIPQGQEFQSVAAGIRRKHLKRVG